MTINKSIIRMFNTILKQYLIYIDIYLLFQFIYLSVKFLTNWTGLPAHNYPAGINLPGGTTLSSPI